MADPDCQIPRFEARSRADLRAWLADNHSGANPVWLVTWKKHSPHYLSYGDLIEELLCWGWIDSQSLGVDEDRTSVRISARNPKSAWSAVNKAKVAAARTSGAMTDAGEALITQAKTNGMWEFLNDVDALILPDDLVAALGSAGRATWEDHPRSVKRAALEWIKTAKTAPTRAKRIADVSGSAAQGLRPTPFRR